MGGAKSDPIGLARENEALRSEVENLRARLEESQEILRAIREGEVDALVVRGPEGDRIYTLQSAEQTYRVLIEQMREGAVILARDGTIHYANGALAAMLGTPLEKIMGWPIQSYCVDATDQRSLAALLEHGSGRKELFLRTGDGGQLPVQISASLMGMPGPAELCLVVTNLTERKQDQARILHLNEELERRVLQRTAQLQAANLELAREIGERQRIATTAEQQRQLLAVTLASIGDGVIVTDTHERVTFLNAEAERLTGWRDREATGQPLSAVFRIIPEKTRQPIVQPLDRVPHFGTAGPASPKLLMARDGRHAPIDVSAAPIRHPGGTVHGVVLVFRDITDARQAERALRESEERFRVAQELSLDAFTILTAVRDHDGTIVDFCWDYVNPAAGRLLRHAPDELLGRRLLQLLPGNQANSELFARYVRVVETGEPHDFELQYDADGVQGWFRNMAVKLADGLAIYFADITTRKQAEQLSQTLNDINALIHSTLDFDVIMQRVISAGTEALRCETAAMSLRDGGHWTVRHVHGLPSEAVGNELRDDQEPHALLAIRTKQPIAIEDAFNDERVNREHMMKWNVRSVLVVPLVIEDQAIGVLFFNNHTQGRRFDQAHVDFAGKLGSSVALAIQNAWLFENAQSELSERRQAEQERQRYADELQTVLDAAPVAVWLAHDPQCRLITGNHYADRLIMQGPRGGNISRSAEPGAAAVSYRVFREGVELQPEELPAQRACASGKPVAEEELTMVFPDGRRVRVLMGAVPLFDGEGQVRGAVIAGADVTNLRRVEEAIRRSEAMLTRAQRVASLGSWEWDIVTGELHWSNEVYRIFGLQRNTFQPTYESFFAAIHPADRDEVSRATDAALAGRPFRAEYRIVRSDSVRQVFAQADIDFDPSGKPTRMVGTVLDITERKQMERALEEAKEVAEAANAAKDQFLAALSHELRTPLTPVLMLSQQLEQDPELPAELRGDMKIIRQNIQLEARLIDDLLDLTRIARGKIQLRPERTSVHELLQHAMQTCCDEVFSSRHLKVEWCLEARSSVVSADPARLEQVFWNLLKNAIKFTPPEGTITIRTCNPDDGQIRVEVIDTGSGIEPDKLTVIFEPFEQGGEATTCRYGGLGLGLAIAKAVTRMHGGTIRADSDGPGRGATFTVTLPTLVHQETATSSAGAAAVTSQATRDGQRARILLVEDHQTTALVLTRLLKKWGWDVVAAGSVQSALEMAATHSFDLVISDLGLPDGHGHDLMRQLRDTYRLQGIALSGYGMERDIEESLASGFVTHLVKPLDFEELKEVVTAFLARAGRS